ncbi:hypothetical protein CIK05_02625 [Bdellovibrio sp. qaytius]|nr:hypothetical protein CIK05_02625 [Bdellovibrio sp. qaytius]
MKYVLFLFFISMVFARDVNAKADIVNRNCNNDAVACQHEVDRKFGRRPPGDADFMLATDRCTVQMRECTTANGGIVQSSGQTAQMWNPKNVNFQKCRETISDTASDAFRDCVFALEGKKKAPEPEPPPPEIVVVGKRPTCSVEFPEKCKTAADCATNKGVWNATSNTCSEGACPSGTTADEANPGRCKCDNEMVATVDRGSASQKCPVQCTVSDHKKYELASKGCVCDAGFQMQNGNCIASNSASPAVDVCLRELQEKATSCDSAASTAVDKCDPKRDSGSEDGDTLGTLQNILGSGTDAYQKSQQATGAVDNCVNAGIASSSGYYALDSLRNKCDDEISSCKSSCNDANSYFAANKDRVYQACRKKAYDENICLARSPYDITSEERFNASWDARNKSDFESQIQQMQTNVTDNKTKCETGTAVTNRDKMSDYMNDMNNSVKSANQCQCQLGSGSDCSNLAGPAECAKNPSLPGCTVAMTNCLNSSDTSLKCVCFRNPNGSDCKAAQQANNAKLNTTETSAFAGVGGAAPGANGVGGVGGSGASGKTEAGGDVNVGDLSGLGADGEAFGSGTSGTATADGGSSPFGSAGGSGAGGGGSSSGGGGASDGTKLGGVAGEEEGTSKKLSGFFDVAKSALGSLFKNGGTGDKNSFSGVNANKVNGGNDSALDSKKWRPRGMVRGLAGDTELAGKFDDIWKVMNKQYKVQDQKDTFIFGGEKK